MILKNYVTILTWTEVLVLAQSVDPKIPNVGNKIKQMIGNPRTSFSRKLNKILVEVLEDNEESIPFGRTSVKRWSNH